MHVILVTNQRMLVPNIYLISAQDKVTKESIRINQKPMSNNITPSRAWALTHLYIKYIVTV